MLIFLNFIAFILQSSLKSMLPFVRIYGPLNKIPNILLTLVVSTCKSPWEMGCCLLLFSHRMGMEMIITALPEITAALCSYLCIFCLNCTWPSVSEGSRVYRMGTVNWIDAVYETLGKSSFMQDEDFSVLLKFFLVCLLEITTNSLTSQGVNFVGIWFIIGTIYLANICLYLSRKAILN